ncbi:hypothetical protein PENTCL1PPCAC_6621, partial [Pristionchus entomophagus]
QMRSFLVLLSLISISLSFSPQRIKRPIDLQPISVDWTDSPEDISSEETDTVEGSGEIDESTDAMPIDSSEETSDEINDEINRKRRDNGEEPRLLF